MGHDIVRNQCHGLLSIKPSLCSHMRRIAIRCLGSIAVLLIESWKAVICFQPLIIGQSI